VSANGSGTVALRAGGATSDLAINGATVSSGTGTVQLVAGQAITTSSTDNTVTEISTGGATGNRIDTAVVTLAASAAGDIFLREANAVTVGSVAAIDGAATDPLLGISTTANNGSITLTTTAGSLTIAQAVTAHGSGTVDLRAGGATSDVNVNGVTVSS